MNRYRSPSLIALAIALAAGATQPLGAAPGSVSDFQLPQPSPTPTAQPQGPVVDDAPPPRAATPRPSPTPTRRPTPTPSPTSTPTPAPAATTASPTPTATGTAAPAPASAADLPSSTGTSSDTNQIGDADEGQTATEGTEQSDGAPQPVVTANPGVPAPEISTQPEAPADGSPVPGPIWPWLLLIAGAPLLLGAAGYLIWRWREARVAAAPANAPLIQRPRPRGEAPPAPPPPKPEEKEDETADTEELAALPDMRFALEARRLSLTLMNATFSYRITITNSGEDTLEGIHVGADMISAHASLPVEEQLAGENVELQPRHRHPRLGPGESVVFNGEFQIPIRDIRPIRKNEAAFFVPLARWKIESRRGGNGALVQTSVVGQRSPRPGAGLQPFRIDLGPRIYNDISQRTFA